MDFFGERRDFRIVQLLVQSGASITLADEDGNTPLSYATEDEMESMEGKLVMCITIAHGFEANAS